MSGSAALNWDPGPLDSIPDSLTSSTFPWPQFPPLCWGQGLKCLFRLSSSDILEFWDNERERRININAIS